MRKLLFDPAFHFTIIAIAIFALFYAAPREFVEAETEPDYSVSLAESNIQALARQFQATWQRPPTIEELEKIVDGAIRQEIYVREATELGLEKNDAAVRLRLVQKIRFITEASVSSVTPDDETLREHLMAEPDLFSLPSVYSFDQVYLGQNPTPEQISATIQQLSDGADPREVGEINLLPQNISNSTSNQVDAQFGKSFSSAVATGALDQWAGPFKSGYGSHLVRLTSLSDARLPELDDVREKVLNDWRRVKTEEVSEAQYQALLAKYEVAIPSREELREVLAK